MYQSWCMRYGVLPTRGLFLAGFLGPKTAQSEAQCPQLYDSEETREQLAISPSHLLERSCDGRANSDAPAPSLAGLLADPVPGLSAGSSEVTGSPGKHALVITGDVFVT